MESTLTILILTVVSILALIFVGVLTGFAMFYVKVQQGWALIINDMSSMPKVKFTGGIVWPVINKKELMKISLITLELSRKSKDGLICQDNIRADIVVAFYLRVNETQEDVLKVAKSIGATRASDRDAINELFGAKFSEALKTVGKQLNFVDLFENRIAFRDKIIEVIGDDLNGYILEDVAIDYLEQTPKISLDANNILDAEGIRKITELTAIQNVQTNEFEKNEDLAIAKKNVETRESMLALERQQADAEARQQREVASIQARESAETTKVQQEERLRAENARIETEEQLQVREENMHREIEVAENNRLRAVAIEEERVQQARDLEIVSREREVAIQTIEKEKALEQEKKEIANLIRDRIAVERTVAEQEEKIKEVRVISEAERLKAAQVIAAEAEAEEELVKQVKQAEADEVKSIHKAKEINILAQAELEVAAKSADAKKQLAEGIKAEAAALGLAEATVKQAHAIAMEKEGLAKASVLKGRMQAEAQGIEAQTIAKEKEGLMEAKVLEEKMDAEAKGANNIGLAQANVTRAKFKAEADGLIDKFNAMAQMSDTARDHEEFRLKLEKQFEQALAEIEASKHIASDQAKVLATALEKANIDIVGGEGDYFKSFARSLSVGKSIDAAMSKSPDLQNILAKFLDTKKD